MKKWKVSTIKGGYWEVNADGISFSEHFCSLYRRDGQQHITVAVFPTNSVDSIVEADSENKDSK